MTGATTASPQPEAAPDPRAESLDYEQAKFLAQHPEPNVRALLATRSDVAPELLYFLANDQAPDVRQAVAENRLTPRQADLVLTGDPLEQIRQALVAKTVEALPTHEGASSEDIDKQVVQILMTLAGDAATSVRTLLADAVKEHRFAPPAVIETLARDRDTGVAGPILSRSPGLREGQIIDLVDEATSPGARSAIAGRYDVTGRVSDAIARTGDVDAIGRMLGNHRARIDEHTLDGLVDQARHHESWQRALVERPDLSDNVIVKLAKSVGSALLRLLGGREDLSPETRSAVQAVSRHREAQGGRPMGEPDWARAAAAAGDVEGVHAPAFPDPAPGAPDPTWARHEPEVIDAEFEEPDEARAREAFERRVQEEKDMAAAARSAELAKEEIEEAKKEAAADGEEDEKTGAMGGAAAAERLFRRRILSEDHVDEAIFAGDRGFITRALALKSKIPEKIVDHMLKSNSARGVVALGWKAGLTMKMTVKLQVQVARIPHKQVLQPGSKDRYPLSVRDMTWQLDFFGAR